MKCLPDLPFKGQRLLMRVDFNVPEGDDTRIREALPSIQFALQHKARLILMSHFGRPGGKVDPKFSLQPVAKRLARLLGQEVFFASDCVGPKAQSAVQKLLPGHVLLLENLRFHPGEEKPEEEPTFSEALAELGDYYCDDAFGCAHRAHTSIMLAKRFPGKSAAGFLMKKEICALSPILEDPKRPFFAILGGLKISTKAKLIRGLLKKVNGLFIGGAMSFPFLAASGKSIGSSPGAPEEISLAKTLPTPILPSDLVIAKGAETRIIPFSQGIPDGWQGMDIGPETLAEWGRKLTGAVTIFWNGPLGVFEHPPFNIGTYGIAKLLASLPATTIVGGGDTVAAIQATGLAAQFSHLSTGGGASLEFLETGSLPGIDALT